MPKAWIVVCILENQFDGTPTYWNSGSKRRLALNKVPSKVKLTYC